MAKEIPSRVMELINNPQSVKILSTCSVENSLHSVPLGSLSAPSSRSIVFAKIMANETHANLENAQKSGGIVSVLAVKGEEAYQVKCRPMAFDTSGPAFQAMRAKLSQKMPLHGVWLLEPVEIINQSSGPDAGKRI